MSAPPKEQAPKPQASLDPANEERLAKETEFLIDELRERENAELMKSLTLTSEKINARASVLIYRATLRLLKSSQTLEQLTRFLILFTILTLTDTFVTYFAPSKDLPLDRAILAILFAVALVILIVWHPIESWISRRKVSKI
ncbi:MAG: hypothetical protein JRN52_02015 [Nitrososphaerota archaeon]|nr:hypothetical protein [Nitrososphaerota archaeon]